MSRYTDENPAEKPAPAVVVQNNIEVKQPAEDKVEEPTEQQERSNDQDQQAFDGGDDDMDDDIDFNLGNGNGYDAPTSHEAHGPGIKEDG